MKAPTWNELQEMFNTEEAFGTISEMVENLVDSPSEDNLLCLAQFSAEVKIVNSETSHFIYNGQVDEMNMNARNNKPLFVYKEEKIEEDRRRFDYIYSFLTDAGKFDDIRPLNRNAVVLMNRDLLKKAAKGKLSVGELKRRGGRIISEIELPEDALLYPTPSSKGLYLCGRCH